MMQRSAVAGKVHEMVKFTIHRMKVQVPLFAGLLMCVLAAPRAGLAQVQAWGGNASGQLGDGTTTNRTTPISISGLTGVIATAPGNYHSLALRSDGTVWAWGSNDDGQLGDGTTTARYSPGQVSGLTSVTAIASHHRHNLALRSDGTVWSWGYNGLGQLGDGTTTSRLAPIHVAGLSGITAIATGHAHSMALKSDGTLWAWGYNADGELGDATGTDQHSPVQISSMSGIVAIVVGDYHCLAIRSDGAVWSWGYNIYGQRGDGTVTSVPRLPTLIGGLTNAKAVASGGHHNLVLRSDGTVWAWGNNSGGQLGDGTTTFRSTPVLVSGLAGVNRIRCGGGHSLARTSDGSVWAWGFNTAGQIGDGTTIDRLIPVQVNGIAGNASISCGAEHNLAIVSSSTASTWGGNANGQLGDGTTTNRTVPITISGLTDVIATSASNYHSLALRSDGTVWTWGTNADGQLGDGTTTDHFSPMQVPGLTGVIAISSHHRHSLALRSDGTVWSWGWNGLGQLGDGTTTTRLAPIQVGGLTSITAIASGHGLSLVLKSDGTLWSWGYGGSGDLGDGTGTNRYSPAQISGISGIVAIAVGNYHTLALRSDGAVWSWGENIYGSRGDGTVTFVPRLPVLLSGLPSAKAVACGGSHSMVLGSDGTVWAWGRNIKGQIGDGTTTDRPSPVLVSALSGVTAITGGGTHSLAIDSYGSVWAWGVNSSGQLGDGTTTDRYSPGQVIGIAGAASISAGGEHVIAIIPANSNHAPIANAGSDQTVMVPYDGNPATTTASFTLNGSASSDEDGDTLTYEWKLGSAVVGTTASLNLSRSAGAYSFVLKITDIWGASSTGVVVVTVKPEPVLGSVSLSSNSITGGNDVTGTVTMTGIVAVDAIISLISTNPNAHPQSTVTVPAGSSSANFTIDTDAVAGDITGDISGGLGGITKTTILKVKAPVLTEIELSDSKILGGSSLMGSVYLSGIAVVDIVVSLTSPNSHTHLPASVIVAAGTDNTGFIITTDTVASVATGDISASLGGIVRTAPLTLTPSTLSELRLSSSSVVGGSTVTGTVSISGLAAADTVVTLATTNPKTHLPPTVIIHAGSAVATFAISTDSVAVNASGNIKASLGGLTKSKALTVRPPSVNVVGIDQTMVTGGLTVVGTVTLTGPVASDTVVSLGSTNVKAHPPTVVTVSAGNTTATFNITTDPVTVQTTGVISATFGGSTKLVTLTIKPSKYSAFVLTPNPVVGGNNITATVTMSGPVAVDTLVTLTCLNAKATLPGPTVTIPAGSASKSFTVATASTASNVGGAVRAQVGTVTKSVTLKVTP